MKAEIKYYEKSFMANGYWNMFGPNNDVFEPGEWELMRYEMIEISFEKYKKYFWKPLER